MAPSLNARHDLVVTELPKLGMEAATIAIEEWGLPKSKITHLIFCTTSCVDMPGADYYLTKLLELSPSVKRFMMYHQACCGGGMAIPLAKDLCENNKGSRVLVVCAEITAILFHGPNENDLDSLVGQALFSNGASAIIMGSDPDLSMEHSIFEIVTTSQTILPNTEKLLTIHLREAGLTFKLHKDIPKVISENIEDVLLHAFSPLGISDWNSLFWIVHPGGRAILDLVEQKLKLTEEKFRASRHVLSEYGNLASASVLFVIEEMRKKSIKEGKSTNGEGLDWGVLLGFGPGLTVETIVLLRSLPVSTPLSLAS